MFRLCISFLSLSCNIYVICIWNICNITFTENLLVKSYKISIIIILPSCNNTEKGLTLVFLYLKNKWNNVILKPVIRMFYAHQTLWFQLFLVTLCYTYLSEVFILFSFHINREVFPCPLLCNNFHIWKKVSLFYLKLWLVCLAL